MKVKELVKYLLAMDPELQVVNFVVGQGRYVSYDEQPAVGECFFDKKKDTVSFIKDKNIISQRQKACVL